jgi:hypothetical protein
MAIGRGAPDHRGAGLLLFLLFRFGARASGPFSCAIRFRCACSSSAEPSSSAGPSPMRQSRAGTTSPTCIAAAALRATRAWRRWFAIARKCRSCAASIRREPGMPWSTRRATCPRSSRVRAKRCAIARACTPSSPRSPPTLRSSRRISTRTRRRPERKIQLIDVRDVAQWMLSMLESSTGGAYQVNGPDRMLTMGAHRDVPCRRRKRGLRAMAGGRRAAGARSEALERDAVVDPGEQRRGIAASCRPRSSALYGTD